MPTTVPAQDLLIRKETHLGVVRELPLNETHIWPSIAPFLSVPHDDVIFDIAQPDTTGLVPARAEDAESEMSKKDDYFGQGSASVVDWAIKDFYTASDVTRFRDAVYVGDGLRAGGLAVPQNYASDAEQFQSRLTRDTARRRRKIENRLEWLTVTQGLEAGTITYNDGKVQFTVDFGRPPGQTDQATAGFDWDVTDGTHDPIAEFVAVQDTMRDTYDIEMGTVIMSPKAIRRMANSLAFYERTAGFAQPAGAKPTDIQYLNTNWGPSAAAAIVEAATGMNLISYDAKYRTRAYGSTSPTINRFMSENKAIFLPDFASAAELIGTDIGFAKTLTSPHPEGNWTSGFYAYEHTDVDPWGYAIGTGIKAFPVFPALELTYTMVLWTP